MPTRQLLSDRSSSGSLFTSTDGWVRYFGRDGMGVRFHWDNPWAGDNSSDTNLDGNLIGYVRETVGKRTGGERRE